jgi:hypothetical protein
MNIATAEAITSSSKLRLAESDRPDVSIVWIYPNPSDFDIGTSSTPVYSIPIYATADYIPHTGIYLDSLAPKIYHRNPEMVKAYLACHPEIEGFIKASQPALISAFGNPVDIVLEVMAYPEETLHSTLIGWIQSIDDVYEGLEKFERFQDEWFLDHLTEISDKFNFNIETK